MWTPSITLQGKKCINVMALFNNQIILFRTKPKIPDMNGTTPKTITERPKIKITPANGITAKFDRRK